jgi:acetyl-CoA carboxylase biotin carboxyl carrier protein
MFPVSAEQPMTLDDIKHLIEFLRQQDVTEFELDYDGVKLRVRSGPVTHPALPVVPAVSVVAAPPMAAPIVVGSAAGNAAPSAASPSAGAQESSTEGTELAIVKSPIVGTFYRASEPGARPFVDVGDTVVKGQVLCIIEAMKLMNEIDSEYDGEVVGIYVENGQAVQYGERLFAIRLK